jgi:hypothetical protein
LTADDVRRRLRQRATELGLDFQQALQYYAIERFLFRVSQTTWADRLIVKGATMLRVWDAAVARPTLRPRRYPLRADRRYRRSGLHGEMISYDMAKWYRHRWRNSSVMTVEMEQRPFLRRHRAPQSRHDG